MRDDAFLARAIDRYHELCADPSLAGPSVVQDFVQAQLDAKLTFGGVVQCRSLRPALLTAERLRELERAVELLWQAFRQIEERALRDASLASALGLSAQERLLAAVEPGYNDATVVSRLDTYFRERPRVLEYNADSPAGISYQAGQAALMRQTPAFARFCQEYRLEEMHADRSLRTTLLGVWHEFADARRRDRANADEPSSVPTIAVVDLSDAATGPEFELVVRDLQAHDIPAFIAAPEDLRYQSGELSAFGKRIDLVYKRLLVADFLAHFDLRHPLIRAYADGAVCVASSFRCTIAHKKKALAILKDPARAGWFSADQRRAIETLVPATWAADSFAGSDGAARAQNELLLKPNDAHGGDGIVLGWDVDAETWLAASAAGMRNGFVVQERVAPRMGTYPVFDLAKPAAGVSLQTLIEDCNAYVFRGRLGGVLTRLSQSQVINVSKGGQAIPTFVLHGAQLGA
ncbi:MAG: hypothetical protein DLM53_04690 [Candidatus Eremiobacter antarcticus]|nr:hypothetical protein [Candidatus Eremiobacteraeota bacterium]MBC5807919.1 hypothetical protein [Candidatus Eremiobacteraeota bacterium]PZR62712.1 MAG: hypothetical protein DLM53_04690 [Candidatus Eremiobacter sp. RRmetagenome_bin22]